MKLWTYHSEDFSPVTMEVDHSKSEYYKEYPEQYDKLFTRLGTRQILWCVTDPDLWPIKTGYQEWQLEVPGSEFFAVFNSSVWNGILGQESVNLKLYDQFLDDARRQGIADAHAYARKKSEERRHPPGDPWENLLGGDPHGIDSNVLLRVPICEEWVVKREWRDFKSLK